MSPHHFDQASRLTFDGPIARGHTDDSYRAFVGPFGGITTATVMRSVLEQPNRLGDPLSITVNFCAPINPGPFELHVREVRTSRSTQHWSVELSQAEAGVSVTATIVMAIRRDSWSHQAAVTPTLPPLDSVPLYSMPEPIPWVQQYRFRFETGRPTGGFKDGDAPRSALSRVWIADREPRTVDFLSLASMADAFFARIFLVRGGLCPFGTVSMTVYFHSSAEELAQENNQAVFGVADAIIFHRSYADQTAQLWSAGGRLLATTQQIAYFKL